jgi:membrane protease YdiL (CAAX protease family)
MKAIARTHAIVAYFVLTFAISWGGVLLVIGGPDGITGTTAQDDPLFPLVFVAMLAGPSLAGVALTGLFGGMAGLRELMTGLSKWRVGARWYAVALLTAPLLTAVVLLAASVLSAQFVPTILATNDRAALLRFAFAVGLFAGAFEEAGWTGFAVPALRLRYGVVATGLIVGVFWGAWHILAIVWGVGVRAGALPLALFVALDIFSVLPAYRVLMVWVYDRTDSLLLAMLMHASLTASSLIFSPETTGLTLVMFNLALAAALWIVVAAVAMANNGRLSRRALWRRAA